MSYVGVLTPVHVGISLIAIVTGILVVLGMLGGKRMDSMTAVFLWTTVLTSVTGFLFPIHGFTPGIGVGIVSLIVLAICLYARYSKQMTEGWRLGYVITAVIALYLNVFVLVVQLFGKVPALKALAPTQSEAPFKITQLCVLLLFIVLGVLAARGFRGGKAAAA